jgi:hypothetical protein
MSRLVIFIALCALLGSMVRFYKLGAIPHGMTWDEAAIGYNGHAIVQTRRDEWLARLPVSFQSFGDYKAPLAIYANGLFTKVFGMNLFAVRLPFALASILTIVGVMLLVNYLFKDDRAAAIAGLFVVCSPWHIHYSRAGFESGLALGFVVWGVYLLLKGMSDVSARSKMILLALSALCLVASLYTYHSAKVTVPLLILGLAILERKKIRNNIKQLLIIGAGALVLLWPLIKDSLYGSGLQRLDSSILNDKSGMSLVLTVLTNLGRHLTPEFLTLGETTTLRHGVGAWGVLLPTTFVFVVVGLVFAVISVVKKEKTFLPYALSLLWILAGLLPAAIGEEIPHSNRALLALPGFIFLAVAGGYELLQRVADTQLNKKVLGTHHEKNILVKSLFGTVMLVYMLFFTKFIHYYFDEFAKNSADDFKDGYIEAFQTVVSYESKIDKILFTSRYGQPYIYALFVRKTNPIWYRGGSLIKYEFTDNITVGDLQREKTVVVAHPQDGLPEQDADKLIYGSDGNVRFMIYTPTSLHE